MNVIIIGGGGFALEVLTYLKNMQENESLSKNVKFSILDSECKRFVDLYKIEPTIKLYDDYNAIPNINDCLFTVAIGNPAARRRIIIEIEKKNLKLINVIHPTSVIAPTAYIQSGVIIGPFSFVGPHSSVRKGATLNIYSSIGHDASLGAYSVLSPYATLNGAATTGEECFLGTNASISPGCSLGARSKLSAGSILNGDTEPNSMAHGNPAKFRVLFKP